MLRLCYVPVYNMPVGLKCVFLNTSSLHKNILHIKASHNICATDIILLEGTRLIPNDNTNDYLIPQYDIPYENDQILDTPTRPSHVIMSYVRTPVRVLEKHKWSDAHFEAILLCVQHTVLPLLVQVIRVYLLSQCKFSADILTHMELLV